MPKNQTPKRTTQAQRDSGDHQPEAARRSPAPDRRAGSRARQQARGDPRPAGPPGREHEGGQPMSTSATRLTIDEYDRMVDAGILPETNRLELIDGRIV